MDMLLFSNSMLINSFNDEVHIKVGGDHGGGSFKMSFQVGNVLNPNSKENTVVFSVFEAKDYRMNIKLGLERFKSQLNELQVSKWQ